MAKKENPTTRMFMIFFRSIKVYLMNFTKFFGYMAFPVFGTLLGSAMILGVTYWFSIFMQANYIFNSVLVTLLVLIVLLIPGFLVFCKAFLDYIIAMVALNSAACDLVATDTLVRNIKSYNSIIQYREKQFLLLIFILSVVYTIFSFPLLWLLAIVFTIYACLSLQAFAADDRFSAMDAIRRSFLLVPGNIFNTAVLLILIGLLTYILVPELIYILLHISGVNVYLSFPVEALFNKMPINEMFLIPINQMMTNLGLDIVVTNEILALSVTKSIVVGSIIGLLLPIRAIACTLWYKELESRNSGSTSAAKKMAKKAKEEDDE